MPLQHCLHIPLALPWAFPTAQTQTREPTCRADACARLPPQPRSHGSIDIDIHMWHRYTGPLQLVCIQFPTPFQTSAGISGDGQMSAERDAIHGKVEAMRSISGILFLLAPTASCGVPCEGPLSASSRFCPTSVQCFSQMWLCIDNSCGKWISILCCAYCADLSAHVP